MICMSFFNKISGKIKNIFSRGKKEEITQIKERVINKPTPPLETRPRNDIAINADLPTTSEPRPDSVPLRESLLPEPNTEIARPRIESRLLTPQKEYNREADNRDDLRKQLLAIEKRLDAIDQRLSSIESRII